MGVQVFTTSGTWVAPVGVTHVIAECWGAGGGGGGGSSSGGGSAGGGGGGGAYAKDTGVTVSPGSSYTVTIGGGGSGGGDGANGSDGGSTSFQSTSAGGGSGGQITGGGSGSSTHSGATTHNGGSGGSGDGGPTPQSSGGGGGAGGQTGDGSSGSGSTQGSGGSGTSQTGGDGGQGYDFGGSHGSANGGGSPGGGGAGGAFASPSGNIGAADGADGMVILTWTDPPSFLVPPARVAKPVRSRQPAHSKRVFPNPQFAAPVTAPRPVPRMPITAHPPRRPKRTQSKLTFPNPQEAAPFVQMRTPPIIGVRARNFKRPVHPQLVEPLPLAGVGLTFFIPPIIATHPKLLHRPRISRPHVTPDFFYTGPAVPIDVARRYAAARGLYRIFNAAAFRFYRSNVAPPAETDTPFATSATLPSTPTSTFSDGTWYLSSSYFNGVLDSGFLPLGPHGETYLTLEISGGVALPDRPSGPTSVQLELLAGGVVRINAFYARAADGTNAATEWAIAYTTNGTTPPSNTPSATPAMSKGALSVLAYKLPAQANGTTVKVQLQTRRNGTAYSLPGAVLSIVVNTTGPTAPLSIVAWPGALPEDL